MPEGRLCKNLGRMFRHLHLDKGRDDRGKRRYKTHMWSAHETCTFWDSFRRYYSAQRVTMIPYCLLDQGQASQTVLQGSITGSSMASSPQSSATLVLFWTSQTARDFWACLGYWPRRSLSSQMRQFNVAPCFPPTHVPSHTGLNAHVEPAPLGQYYLFQVLILSSVTHLSGALRPHTALPWAMMEGILIVNPGPQR